MHKKITLIFILIYFFVNPNTYATDQIISSQMEALNISSFVKEGQTYTKNAFPDINISELLNSSIKGKIDNKSIFKDVFSLFGKEIASSISLIASILVVVIIHNILKSFSDNLESKGVIQIAYYVEYILIVTLIMANFSNVINLIKESISNLIGFVNTLIPILLALMVSSRKHNKCCIYRTFNTFFCNIHRKYNYISYSSNYIYTEQQFQLYPIYQIKYK